MAVPASPHIKGIMRQALTYGQGNDWASIEDWLSHTLSASGAYSCYYPYKMVPDDSSAGAQAVNSAALQKNLEAARTDGKSFIMLPGKWYVDQPIEVESTRDYPLDWCGLVPHAAKLVAGTAMTNLVQDPSGVTSTFQWGHIGGLTLECNRLATNGINLREGVNESHLLNLHVHGHTGTGILIQATTADSRTRSEVNMHLCYVRGDRNGLDLTDHDVADYGIQVHGHSDCFFSNNYMIGHEFIGLWLSGSTHMVHQCHAYKGKANPVSWAGNPWFRYGFRLGKDGSGDRFFVTACQVHAEIHVIEFHGTGRYYLGGEGGARNELKCGVQDSGNPSPYDDAEQSACYYFRANTHSNIRLMDNVMRSENVGHDAYTVPKLVGGAATGVLAAGEGGYTIEPVLKDSEFASVEVTRLRGRVALNTDTTPVVVDPSPRQLLGPFVNTSGGIGMLTSRVAAAGHVTWDYDTTAHDLTLTPATNPGSNAYVSYDIETGKGQAHTFS